jgi:hypothetical protein
MVTENKTAALIDMLTKTENAHGEYESTVLNGVYDQNWPDWYATYLVQNGLDTHIGRKIAAETLSHFLRDTYALFKQENPTTTWQAYIAQKMLE